MAKIKKQNNKKASGTTLSLKEAEIVKPPVWVTNAHPLPLFLFKGVNLHADKNVVELATELKYKERIIQMYKGVAWYMEDGFDLERAVTLNKSNPPSLILEKEIAKIDDRIRQFIQTDGCDLIMESLSDELFRFFVEGNRIIVDGISTYAFKRLVPFFEKYENTIQCLEVECLLHKPKLYRELDCDELDREMVELVLLGIGYEQARQQFTEEKENDLVSEILKPLSGTWKGITIMEAAEYSRLLEYARHTLNTDTVPNSITPIKKSGSTLPKDFYKKTIHILFKRAGKGTHAITWCNFLKAIFKDHFTRPPEVTMLTKKFSEYRGDYESDKSLIKFSNSP